MFRKLFKNDLPIHPLIDKENQKKAKKYHKEKKQIKYIELGLDFVLLFLFLFYDLHILLADLIKNYTDSFILTNALYISILIVAITIINLPFSYYLSYYHEHKWDFSNQSISNWIGDKIKGLLLSLILGSLVIIVLYEILDRYPDSWWIWFTTFMFLFSIILTKIAPVLILPLFYKTKPIEDIELKEKLIDFAKKLNIKIKDVYQIELSEKTKKANAMVTGLGATKKILLGDTLLSNYSYEEIESVLAHEMGHYVNKDIVTGLILNTIFLFIVCFLLFLVFPYAISIWDINSISAIEGFIIFALCLKIINIIFEPISMWFTRFREKKADLFAIEKTKNPDAFMKVMSSFANKYLINAYPMPIKEFFTFDHPSIGRRIKMAEDYKTEIQKL